MDDTRGEEYATRLTTLSHRRWKTVIGAQLPYRWNIRRLLAGREHVLDVGCGIGRNLVNLGRGVGVDHNPTSVEVARQSGLRAWTSAEWADSPDARPASFDAMVLSHVLEHLDEATADEVVRSYLPYLRPDARLLLVCPQERGYASDPTHVRWVDLAALRRAAFGWGFTPVRAMSFPFPRAAGRLFLYNEFVLAADRHAVS